MNTNKFFDKVFKKLEEEDANDLKCDICGDHSFTNMMEAFEHIMTHDYVKSSFIKECPDIYKNIGFDDK